MACCLPCIVPISNISTDTASQQQQRLARVVASQFQASKKKLLAIEYQPTKEKPSIQVCGSRFLLPPRLLVRSKHSSWLRAELATAGLAATMTVDFSVLVFSQCVIVDFLKEIGHHFVAGCASLLLGSKIGATESHVQLRVAECTISDIAIGYFFMQPFLPSDNGNKWNECEREI